MKHLVKLYPRSWRDRYGEELEALLEDTGIDRRIVVDVLMGGVLMQVARWRKAAAGITASAALVAAGAWWAARSPYITPGTHQTFRMDSAPGALLEVLAIVVWVIAGVATILRATRAGRIFGGIGMAYAVALIVVSLVTPRTIVSVGDSYCWDLWCVGIGNIHATAQGANTRYKAEVSLFADSTTAELQLSGQANKFFYATDDSGRRFSIYASGAPGNAPLTVKPGEIVKSSLSFVAPANVQRLYLTGDVAAPWWVRLYFGSDLNPFHRRTLLRVA